MSHNLTPVSSRTNPVTVPDSGDARTAASVVTFAQQLYNLLTPCLLFVGFLIDGGSIYPTAALNIRDVTFPPTGSTVVGTGGIKSAGRVSAPIAAVAGGLTAGTYNYALESVDHVYALSSVAAGVNWAIGYSGTSIAGGRIRLVNLSTTSVTVKDFSGNTIATIGRAASGNIHSNTYVLQNDLVTWIGVDPAYTV